MTIKFNLRKANAIQGEILKLISGVKVTVKTSINEFEDAGNKITDANNAAMQADKRRADLLMALYSIRTQVGVANAQSGVVAKLTHAAFIDKRLAQLEGMSTDENVMLRPEVINGKLDKIRNRTEDSSRGLWGRGDEVETGVMTQEQVDNVRRVIGELRRQKQTLNDEILELNVRTEIEITPEVETVLVEAGIV